MSRRKLGLRVHKGFSRKRFCPNKCSENFVDDPDELPVRLPLDTYCSHALPDTSSLANRLSQSGKLPQEWTLTSIHSTTSLSPTLTLYILEIKSPLFCCADYSFMLTISPDGTWTLCVGRTRVYQEHCDLLKATPTKLCSVDDVIGLVLSLSGSKWCIGNPDEKFMDLIDRHEGNFRDQTGTL